MAPERSVVKLDLRRVAARGGHRIAFLDYEPRRPRGVTLVCGHGYSSSKHNLDFLCAFLASHGFAVLSLDFPGHKLGASEGRLQSVDDLTGAMAAVVAFARARGDATIYTLGHSMGASTALRACAEDPMLAGAISIATGYGRPTALAALGALSGVDLRSSYVDGLSLHELAAQTESLIDGALARVAGRPVLYIGADRDGMVSPGSARELFDRAPDPKSYAIVSSDHTYAAEHSRAAVLAWLNERHAREPRVPA